MAQKLITSQDVEHIGPMVLDRVRVALESRRDPDDPDAEYFRYALSIEGHEIVKRVSKLDPVSNVAAQAAEVQAALRGLCISVGFTYHSQTWHAHSSWLGA